MRCVSLYNWENVTELFSEDERHYKNTYLEINEVYDDIIEVMEFQCNSITSILQN